MELSSNGPENSISASCQISATWHSLLITIKYTAKDGKTQTRPSDKSGEVGGLIEVDPRIGLLDESGLLAKGPDDAGALHRLVEVGVDGRAAHSFKPPQLTGCGDVEAL